MARTIYGCVNRATKEIDFDVCNPADFLGCIERTGIHTGQVKLTISGLLCDDTYYGCINRSTGKFQIIVPDDCCFETYSETDCGCFDPGVTPLYYTVEFSGIRLCETEGLDAINGIYLLTQDTSENCFWVYDDGIHRVELRLTESGYTHLSAGNKEFYPPMCHKYKNNNNPSCTISASDQANELDIGDCSLDCYGYDGIASWCKFWNITGCP